MSKAADRRLVYIFAERRTLVPVYHALGQYVPLEDAMAREATGKAKQLSKCGLLVTSNPFGYHGTRTIEHTLALRLDHARCFATPCQRCYQ